MIIFQRPIIDLGRRSRHVVAMFGMGLVGRAIVASLLRLSDWTSQEFAFSWRDQSQRIADRSQIEQFLVGAKPIVEGGNAYGIGRLDIVWAAGRAGFASSQSDVEQELEAFHDVVILSERLRQQAPMAHHAFHLFSSAGGLFEGQRQIDRESAPAPKRPYGALKLEQERHLAATSQEIMKLIYRPSSVYGYSGTGLRVGLVSALVQNGIRHRVSRIFGEPHTIRDYVLASDIGSFLAKHLTAPPSNSQVFLLASGKPSSMFEMLHKIEQTVGRKLYCQFDSQPSNASHISFCKSALPVGWNPTDLDTGIRLTALQLSGAFVRSE
jgi:nucleoside-diphosphate-sugar epimerase